MMMATAEARSRNEHNADQLKILIVEDNVDLQIIFETAFSSLNATIDVAPNGKEALDYLEYNLPDVVVTDINMPLVSGLVVLEAMKTDPRFANTRTIVVTGNTVAATAPETEFADLVLQKPVNVMVLLRMVKRLMQM